MSLRGKIKYAPGHDFKADVQRRVAEFFEKHGRSGRGDVRMWSKTTMIMAWFVVSYIALVFFASSAWTVGLFSVSLALAMAGIGFNIQHDGAHGSYSTRAWVNKIMATFLDGIGGSSYMWKWQHNVIHHTYTNVEGADEDINLGPLARVAPDQKLRWLHRFQHFYVWFLYSFVPLKWWFHDDVRHLVHGKLGRQEIPRPKGWALVKMFSGKLFFLSWALIIPLLLHSWTVVLPVFLLVSGVLGVVLAVVFQLAHCVEDADFPSVADGNLRISRPWFESQVETTVDFCRNNKLITWYLGGLNFQIEHHLFPKVCHVHYPSIAPIVEQACKEHGVRYTHHRSLFAALAAHGRWLRMMGRRQFAGS